MFQALEKFSHLILRKRSLEKSASLETNLCRCLSVVQLFFYSVSVMAGAGIYILAGHVIKNRAGPSTNLSFLIGGLSSFFTGLCYCELATLMPQAGSCYTYTYVMIGELPAFIIAWTVIMDCMISLASVAKGFSGVVNMASNDAVGNFTRTFLPLVSNSPVWDSSPDLIAALLIFILFLITITGANISFHMNSALQSMQILCLATVTIAFFIYGSPSNFYSDGGIMPFGFAGVVEGAGIAIFAYSGFECVANCAEEMKNPKKSIPIALFASLGFVIVLYCTVTTGLSYMVPRLQIQEKSPFASAFENRGLDGFKWIAVTGTLIATGATKLSVTYIIGRVIYAVAKDGLIFKFLGNVNETTQVPIRALFVGCLFAMIMALFVKIEVLADITSMGILISFITVGIDLIILRYLLRDRNTEKTENSETLQTRFLVNRAFEKRASFVYVFVAFLLSMLLLQISFIFILKHFFYTGVILCTGFLFVSVSTFVLICFYEPYSQDDTFQTPLMPLAPILTIVVNSALLLSLPGDTWIRFIVWLLVGLIIYFGYGIRNSSQEFYDMDFVPVKKDCDGINEEKKLLNETYQTL